MDGLEECFYMSLFDCGTYIWPGSQALLHLALAKYAIQPYLHTHSSKITRYRYKFPTIIAASCLQYRSTIRFPNTFQCLVPHTP